MKDNTLYSCMDVLSLDAVFSREIKCKGMIILKALSSDIFHLAGANIIKKSVCQNAVLVGDNNYYLYQFFDLNEEKILTMVLFSAAFFIDGIMTNDRLDNVLQHIQTIEVISQEGAYCDTQSNFTVANARHHADFLIGSLH